MSTDDTIGIVRDHRWMRAGEQRKRLRELCRVVIELESDTAKAAAKVFTRDDLGKLVREGTTLKLMYAFLLAEPRRKRTKGGLAADFTSALSLIVDKRRGVVCDVLTGLCSDTPDRRRALVASVKDQIRRSQMGLRSNENGARSKGRPKQWTDAQEREIIWQEWHSTANRTNGMAAEAATKRIGRDVSPNTMYRVIKELRAERGIGGTGASGRRPHVKALIVAHGSKRTEGTVYFLKNGRRRQIKIGYSGNAKVRAKELGTATPEHLRILAVVPGTRAMESELHVRFGKYHIKGDWFRHEGKLAQFVSGLPKYKHSR